MVESTGSSQHKKAHLANQKNQATNEKTLKEKQKELEKELQTSKTSTADLRKEIEELKEC